MGRLWKRHWTANIAVSRTDIQLVILGYATGVIDALSVARLNVFSSNQTGNTVLLGVAIAGVKSDLVIVWSRNLVALLAFWFAVFVSGQLGHRIGTRKRWWLVSTHLVSSLILYVAGILIYTGLVNISASQNDLVFLTLTGVSYGIQAATVRPLNVPEIPTVVVTSAMVDLWSDKNLLKAHNVGRNRRVAFIAALFLGALSGAFLIKDADGHVVILAASVKLAVALSFMLNADEPIKENGQPLMAPAPLPASPPKSTVPTLPATTPANHYASPSVAALNPPPTSSIITARLSTPK
ncbi:hypothetical protein BZG36_00647 [Bifiguratus adelaidae]|uniref:DUF1275 domain-containing protein n=1 Tax=Bifiguratus adelaidae TaxID=1938954 RepID=A0A261Y709_9FUNG|nr:hypothetical protein BZG36_00647 [Bifiguratus adelaidae]